MYPDESSYPFLLLLLPITTSLSPPRFLIIILSKGHEGFFERRKGFEILFFFLARTFFLPSVGYFYPREEGGTCKVDVSRNKIKLKIASIVAVSFVILRHFRAPTRETTLLERRRRLVVDWWCGGGNRSPLARKRMRPKKNRYNRLYTILSS